MEGPSESSKPKEDSSKAPRPGRGAFNLPTKDRNAMLFGLRIAGDFGIAIAAPVVLFALLGRWIDRVLETSPWFMIAGFIFAAIVTAISISRKAKRYGEEYKNMGKK